MVTNEYEYCCRSEDCYNLIKKYEKCSPYLNHVSPWTPIDINLVLPMHEAYGRMPGLFQARKVSIIYKSICK